jgi:hypothetical protein
MFKRPCSLLVMLISISVPPLLSQTKSQSVIVTQAPTRLIASKGDTIRIAWSRGVTGSQYDLSVLTEGKSVFEQLVTHLQDSNFVWIVPSNEGQVKEFRVVRSVKGGSPDTISSGDPAMVRERGEQKLSKGTGPASAKDSSGADAHQKSVSKDSTGAGKEPKGPLQGSAAVESKDSSGSNRGFGFNLGANFDLIDGLKNSTLYSEVRFREPILIGLDSIDGHVWFPIFSGIGGGSVALRQSRTHYPNDKVKLAIASTGTSGQAVQMDFARTIEMNVTTLELSLFLPIYRYTANVIAQKPWSVSDRTDVLVTVTCAVELFDKNLSASYEPKSTDTKTGQGSNQGSTAIDSISSKAVGFSETLHSGFNSRYGIGLTLFLETPSVSYQLQYLQSSDLGCPSKSYGYISSYVYLKKLAGISLGLRYWGYRGPELPEMAFASDRPAWTDAPKYNTVKDEFEFFLVKYFSLDKILEIFKI